MKLTKLQRHTAYIIMLEESKDKNNYICTFYEVGMCSGGFCWMIYKLFGFGYGGSQEDIKKYLPDLYAKKPPNSDRFWFNENDEWLQRIALLKQCIEETA